MKKIFSPLIVILFVLSLSISFVLANEEETFAAAEEIIKQKISCDSLTEDQLETLGDYYMEQMHPGELHEIMDERMGGEGSESLRQIHINMARSFYCGERGMMSAGMMNMMMGGNMMGNYPSYYGYGYNGFWNILWSIFLMGVIALVIWFIYKLTKKGKESETPINILQKRFAKGEINKKQFEEIKKEMEE